VRSTASRPSRSCPTRATSAAGAPTARLVLPSQDVKRHRRRLSSCTAQRAGEREPGQFRLAARRARALTIAKHRNSRRPGSRKGSTRAWRNRRESGLRVAGRSRISRRRNSGAISVGINNATRDGRIEHGQPVTINLASKRQHHLGPVHPEPGSANVNVSGTGYNVARPLGQPEPDQPGNFRVGQAGAGGAAEPERRGPPTPWPDPSRRAWHRPREPQQRRPFTLTNNLGSGLIAAAAATPRRQRRAHRGAAGGQRPARSPSSYTSVAPHLRACGDQRHSQKSPSMRPATVAASGLINTAR